MKRLLILIPCFLFLFWTSFAQTQHSVTLNWAASTTVGVNYNAYRSLTSGGPYTKLNFAPVSVLTYVDTTGVGGTKYYYVVTAVCTSSCPSGISGESGYSNEVALTFLGNPAGATGLTGVAN